MSDSDQLTFGQQLDLAAFTTPKQAGMDQQSTKASPKASPARKGESPPSPIRSEANELITEARREAEDILSEARSEAATQASSLLEVGETLVINA